MRRRWYQFSLRSLLIGVFALAELLAIWRWLVEPYRDQRATMAAIAQAGGQYETQPGGPRWLRAVLSDAWFPDVTSVGLGDGEVDEQTLDRVLRLPTLRSLVVSGPAFTDQRLERLLSLAALEQLIVGRSAVTRPAVDAFEQARPDVSLLIVVSFSELAPAGGEKCRRLVSWSANVEWGPAAVPDSARQWTGKVVRMTGVPWSMGHQELEVPPGPSRVSRMGLRAAPITSWVDVVPLPWETVTVCFRVPAAVLSIHADERTTVEGVFSVPEADSPAPVAYSLRDATIVHAGP